MFKLQFKSGAKLAAYDTMQEAKEDLKATAQRMAKISRTSTRSQMNRLEIVGA